MKKMGSDGKLFAYKQKKDGLCGAPPNISYISIYPTYACCKSMEILLINYLGSDSDSELLF